jgi:hypothetical protein
MVLPSTPQLAELPEISEDLRLSAETCGYRRGPAETPEVPPTEGKL